MKGYQTHEAFWADLKMYINMVMRAIMLGLVVQVAILLIAIYGVGSELFNDTYVRGTNIKMPASVAMKYYTGFSGLFMKDQINVEPQLQPYANSNTRLPLDIYRGFVDWLTDDAYINAQDTMSTRFYMSFWGYVVTVIYLAIFISTAKKIEEEKFLRGAQITPIKVLNKKLAQEAKKSPLSCLTIGDTILPFEMEPTHILILGTAGSGKGVLLNQLVAQNYIP